MTKRANRLRLLGCCCVAVLLASSVAGQDDRIARHAQAAQQAQREGDFAAAIREFTILTRLLPEVAEVYSNLGVAYYFHKQRVEALAAFEKALRLKPDLAAALIFSGIANYKLSKPAKAVQSLSKYLAATANDASAHFLLMQAYRRLGDAAAAERHLAKFKRLSDDEKRRASIQEALSLFSRDRKPEQ